MNEATGNGEPNSSSELDRAEREVAQAEAALSHRLSEAKTVGEETLKRALSVAKPVLIGVAVVGGLVWIVSMLRRSNSSRMRPMAAVTERSVAAEVVRTAALSLASVAARRVAERYLASPDLIQSISTGRAGSPQAPLYAR
jgi:hypothetical protein